MTATAPRLERETPPSASATLRPLLAPRSIAVIGASRSTSMGRQILTNLIAFGFSGAVYPVHPHASSIGSVKAYPTIRDVPDEVDLAVIVVPQPHVESVAEQCAAAGVKSLIVISAGFKETGNEGAGAERALRDLVQAHGIRMVGPNCMGVVNMDPAVSMNATFATTMPPFGHSAFVSQSGALGLSVLDHAREYGIGISQFVSIGNKADVSGNDLLLAWEHDAAIRVILMYVENFGNPRRFREIASRITKSKPIIAVKAGRSRAGARAAWSHTGALAASDDAVDALFTQTGVFRAESIEELFELASAFDVDRIPRSRRTAVITNAGGPGILAADAMEKNGIELADLSPRTIAVLWPLFPPSASIRNPLDMIASATPAGYRAAMNAVLADPAVDAVVPIFVPPFGVKQADVVDAIVSAAAAAPRKTVLAVLMGRDGLPEGRAELHAAGIPAYVFPESAARALAALNRHREWCETPESSSEPLVVDRCRAMAIIQTALAAGREMLDEQEALELLGAYDIPVAEARLVTSIDGVRQAMRELGGPVVLKVVSPEITHKSDVGGVHVGITEEIEAAAAYTQLLRRVRMRAPGKTLRGVLVQRMVSGGQETIAGIVRDAKFPPLVMFGLGGVFVEAMHDVVFRLAPLDDDEAAAMVNGIRGARILRGMRGAPACDRGALADVLRRIAQLAEDFPEIQELDCNPLIALPDGAVVADARVRVAGVQPVPP